MRARFHSAEDFIRMAGSESSMSGKPYRVACPDEPEVDSQVWLEAALRRIREAAARQAAPESTGSKPPSASPPQP
jgi:hypothetical protein